MAQNFLNFMQFFGKFWQYRRLAPPPKGNPGPIPDTYAIDVPLNMDSIPVTTIPVRVAPGCDVSIDLKTNQKLILMWL